MVRWSRAFNAQQRTSVYSRVKLLLRRDGVLVLRCQRCKFASDTTHDTAVAVTDPGQQGDLQLDAAEYLRHLSLMHRFTYEVRTEPVLLPSATVRPH